MTSPVYNFSAGPAVLFRSVLEKAQSELLDFANTGSSVMEISHRSKEFERVNDETEADLRALYNVPDNYKILFMQGGATAQFSAVVYNLIPGGKSQPADYVVTGAWSEKAVAEAKGLGAKVNVVCNTKASGHNGSVPPVSEWKFSPDAAFVFYVDNETIHGVEFPEFPFDAVPAGVPVVCDMSSNILSRPCDVSKYGVIFAGAQKNIGPAGVTVVIIREDLLSRKSPDFPCPVCLDYKICAANKSLYNTPPTFAIYLSGLVFKHLIAIGGIGAITAHNNRKAEVLYDAIEKSSGFYRCPVQPAYRSRMNLPFRIYKDGQPSEALESLFVKEAEARRMSQLKGHRSVGGIRASLYNALPLEASAALAAFMTEFAGKHA
ncbi:pyridoxal phosphate-dependent transferase [Polychytrium aggregatum]|uniref:pyridoxal phosphate-dependent transferase n=1 Tax=Polychytrium aggregatum TaxID=110093 RepID=UPI0022FE437B|nr:pyridoxal phosphate-dependent transferase [Polychytrium aggregatum]KAI9205399.1 pyridoxal phosphate-dependent transferase [Polychytrium aggregatum]